MAKWISLMKLAACLMILLPVVARATVESSDSNGDGENVKENLMIEESKGIQPINSIKAFFLRRTPRYSLEKLSSGRTFKLPIKLIRAHVEALRRARKDGKSLSGLDIPSDWLPILTLRQRSLECRPYFIDSIAYYATDRRARGWKLRYALDCFRVYLNTCGHEARYRKLIAKINPGEPFRHQTLDSYLRQQLFSHSFENADQCKAELNLLLSAVEELSELEIVTSEAASKHKLFLDSLVKAAENTQLFPKWTSKQWAIQAKSTIQELSDVSSSQLSPEQIQKHIEALREAQKHGVSLESLGMPSDWTALVTLRERGLECKPYFIGLIARYTTASGWLSKYALDCLCDYLNQCNYRSSLNELMLQHRVFVEGSDSPPDMCDAFVREIKQNPAVAKYRLLPDLKRKIVTLRDKLQN